MSANASQDSRAISVAASGDHKPTPPRDRLQQPISLSTFTGVIDNSNPQGRRRSIREPGCAVFTQVKNTPTKWALFQTFPVDLLPSPLLPTFCEDAFQTRSEKLGDRSVLPAIGVECALLLVRQESFHCLAAAISDL